MMILNTLVGENLAVRCWPHFTDTRRVQAPLLPTAAPGALQEIMQSGARSNTYVLLPEMMQYGAVL